MLCEDDRSTSLSLNSLAEVSYSWKLKPYESTEATWHINDSLESFVGLFFYSSSQWSSRYLKRIQWSMEFVFYCPFIYLYMALSFIYSVHEKEKERKHDNEWKSKYFLALFLEMHKGKVLCSGKWRIKLLRTILCVRNWLILATYWCISVHELTSLPIRKSCISLRDSL